MPYLQFCKELGADIKGMPLADVVRLWQAKQAAPSTAPATAGKPARGAAGKENHGGLNTLTNVIQAFVFDVKIESQERPAFFTQFLQFKGLSHMPAP